MKTFTTILITAVFSIGATWWLAGRSTPSAAAGVAHEHKSLGYQCAMHPWIKSDKPGRCTICGMELTPISDAGMNAVGGENVLALTANQIHVLDVRTEEVKIQPLVHTLQVAGMIDDDERRHRIISAYVDGRVDKLFANHHGAEVTAGTPLAELYSPELLQAQREYRQLTGTLKENTALRLRQMGLTVEQIAALPDKPVDALDTEILATLSGTVVEHNVYEGQYVKAGEKLFEIADFSTMWFQFNAYEQDLPWIQTGQAVTISTPSKPGRTFEGKITFIDPNFDEATRSTKVRVELPNPRVDGRRELLHRLYAQGTVSVDAPAVLTAPRSAVIQTGPQAVVYVEQGGGAYAQTEVTIGRRGDTLVEIVSGLKAGDKVVTNGNLLIDGQAELNRSFMTPTESAPSKSTGTSLTEAQQAALRDFVQVADAMATALGADDLAAFNKASEPAMMKTAALTEALAGLPEMKGKLDSLAEARHFHGAADLISARNAYLKFTVAASDVLEALRRSPGFPDLKIWECPMVDQAIMGAPKKAHWIQASGRPGLNPFFGKAMPDCGKEIKP